MGVDMLDGGWCAGGDVIGLDARDEFELRVRFVRCVVCFGRGR